jgi:hypothetical protein
MWAVSRTGRSVRLTAAGELPEPFRAPADGRRDRVAVGPHQHRGPDGGVHWA